MKRIVIAFCLFSFALKAQIKIDSLQENIAELKQLILKEQKVLPAHYYLTANEINWINAKAGEARGQERSITNKEYISTMYSSAITRGDGVLNFIAQDTVTFYDDHLPMLGLFMSFNFKNTSPESKENQTIVAVYSFYFLVAEGKMKLGRVKLSHQESESIANGVKRVVKTMNSRAYSSKCSEKCFTTSYHKLIPFEKNNLWGLVNLQGQEVLSPQFDTIFPFDYGYAKVAIKGEYNLLGKNMKLLLPENHKYLKKVQRGYLYSDENVFWQEAATLSKNEKDYNEVVEVIADPSNGDDLIAYAGPVQLSPADSIREYLFKEYYGDSKISVQQEVAEEKVYHYLINSETNQTKTFYGYSSLTLIGSNYLFGKRGDSSLVLTLDGKMLFGSRLLINSEEPGYFLIYDSSIRKFGVYCPYTNVYIAPKYLYIHAVDRDRFFIVLKSNGEIGYLDGLGNELF